MILTAELEQQIIDEVLADPAEDVILPDWAYSKGRVVVLVDGLPIDLHRHLHNVMIRPLGYHERMWRQPEAHPHNVNPYLFDVIPDGRSSRKACAKGHAYEGNEAPPNSRGYRCATCLKALLGIHDFGQANARKTHCPQKHEYTPENTLVGKDGKRRCRTCRRTRNAAYMRRLRSITKESK